MAPSRYFKGLNMAQNTAGFNFSNDPLSPASDVNAENLKKLVEEATIYKIGQKAVMEGHLSPNIAGAGMGGGGGSALFVKTDGQTLEINSDALQVKEGGINTQHLAAGSITLEKLSEAVTSQINSFLKTIYKVGDYFITHNDENPSKRFGGTWELCKDVFLIGAGGNYDVLSTGGEETHTLTIEEMPSHNHTRPFAKAAGKYGQTYDPEKGSEGGHTKLDDFPSSTVGGGKAHNNMPPYKAVYIWVKISDEDEE